jgi:hypothetical protein
MCVCGARTYNSYAVADRVQEALVDGEIGARPAFLLPQSAELRLSAFNYTGNDHFYQSSLWLRGINLINGELPATSRFLLHIIYCDLQHTAGRSLEIYMIHSTRAFQHDENEYKGTKVIKRPAVWPCSVNELYIGIFLFSFIWITFELTTV